MFFASPMAFAGAVAIVGLFALYIYRVRFRRRHVSSLMLWRSFAYAADGGLRRANINTPWFFYLEFAILVSLIAAAATPLVRRYAQSTPIVVFDTSASMAANSMSAVDAGLCELSSISGRFQLVTDDGSEVKNRGIVSLPEAKSIIKKDVSESRTGGSIVNAVNSAMAMDRSGRGVLVVTDEPPSVEYQLPDGVRWFAFGEPAENTAITYASRSFGENGDSVFLEFRCFPPSAKRVAFTISSASAIDGTPFEPIHAEVFTAENGVARFARSFETGTPELCVKIASDALKADNSVVLPNPASRQVRVALDFDDVSLRAVVRRAVESSELAELVPFSVTNLANSVLFTDRDPSKAFDAAYRVAFVKPLGPRRVSMRFMADSSVQLFDGIDFSCIAWNIGTNALPGRGILFAGNDSVISLESPTRNPVLRLFADGNNLSFFRTTAFPSLVYNILEAAATHVYGAAITDIRFPRDESDLMHKSKGDFGSLLTAGTLASDYRNIAFVFAFAAALMLFVHGRFCRGVPLLRAVIYVLCLVAVFRPYFDIRAKSGTVVVVADRSSSITPDCIAGQRRMIDAVDLHRDGTRQKLGVVSFASGAVVEHYPQSSAFQGFRQALQSDASDLAAGIERALELIEERSPGRIVVLSDGLYTGADPRGSAALHAAARGVAIDYRLQNRGGNGDVSIVRVDAPLTVHDGETPLATAWISSPVDVAAVCTLKRGHHVVFSSRRELRRGLNGIIFRDANAPSGVNTYEISVDAAETVDSVPENNAAKFIITSGTTKPLLLIPASGVSRLSGLLSASGIRVVNIEPGNVDWSPAGLSAYSGIIVENRRADDIGSAALESVAAWVEHAGGSFALTGGRNSYGSGGYYKSPIAEMLPVSMELRNEQRKFSVAIAIALDRSGSMAAPVVGGRQKMDLANLASADVVTMLSDDDEVSVIAVDSAPHAVLPLMKVADAKNNLDKVLGIESMGGGIFVYEALKASIVELAKSKASVKHIILFADASDSEMPGEYAELIAGARKILGVSISVIGLGVSTDCDAVLLDDIAMLGGGVCSFTADAREIPRLFAQDTIVMARNTVVSNQTPVVFTAALSQFSDRVHPSAPMIGGYNLCYPQTGATVVMHSGDKNTAPLLAMRPYGSGRVLAFTGEADGELSGAFAKWSDISEFYAAMARYCAGQERDSEPGLLLQQRKISGGIAIDAYVDHRMKKFLSLDGLDVNLIRHDMFGTSVDKVRLEWIAADKMSATIPLRGSETVLPVVTLPGGQIERLPAVCLPYSPEFAPDGARDGAAVLSELADFTGGKALADPSSVWLNLPKGIIRYEFAPWLYLLAALIFLFEIFERRTCWFASRAFVSRKSFERPVVPDNVEKNASHARPFNPKMPAPVQQTPPVPFLKKVFVTAKHRAGEKM